MQISNCTKVKKKRLFWGIRLEKSNLFEFFTEISCFFVFFCKKIWSYQKKVVILQAFSREHVYCMCGKARKQIL